MSFISRGYAASCRHRRDETEESIRNEILELNVKVAEKIVRIETTNKDIKAFDEQLKSFGMRFE